MGDALRFCRVADMRKLLYLSIALLGLASITPAQSIPKELWGTWVVKRQIPTTTISCWDEKQAKAVLGTKIEYSENTFRWKRLLTKKATAHSNTISAEKFHDDNSGHGSSSSQVTFQQLEIKADSATQIVVQHPDASITGATSEIPGDNLLIKDENTIVFSVCGDYFEAERVNPPAKK
jgi:hypothetical protein